MADSAWERTLGSTHGEHHAVQSVVRRPPRWLAGVAVFGAGVLVGALGFRATASDIEPDDNSPGTASGVPVTVQPRSTYAEFFFETSDGWLFERVDRANPEPMAAQQTQTCFTDPAWGPVGAPFDRAELLNSLPIETRQGVVNVMGQCELVDGT